MQIRDNLFDCLTARTSLLNRVVKGWRRNNEKLIRGSEAFIPFCQASYHCAVLPVSLDKPLVETFSSIPFKQNNELFDLYLLLTS